MARMMTATNFNMRAALALVAELGRRGIRLSAKRGQIVARPKGATPPALGEQIRQYKSELLLLLAEPWVADRAEELLRGTLAAIEKLVDNQSSAVHQRVGDVIAEFGPIIEGLFLRQDLDSLRYCLLDLERNANDAIHGRAVATMNGKAKLF